jgi:two-component system chemotaxis response regulator CheY
MMRKIMKKIVIKNGYEVVGEASNGEKGVEKYKELNPDIVTMDFVMDVMNGMEALGQIIALDPDANVVMVSSMGQDVIARDAIVLGAKNYILKPFTERQIMDAFEKL